jgi:hypothetical protein
MFIIEISTNGEVSACTKRGNEIGKRSTLYSGLLDCTKSGDCEAACRYVMENHKPEFRTVRKTGDKYANVLASDIELEACARSIYFESDTDFAIRDNAELYLVWQAAHDVCQA